MRSVTHLGLAALLVLSTAVFAQAPASAPAERPAPDNPTATPTKSRAPDAKVKAENKSDILPSPGENLDTHIKKGSEDDVNAVGNRDIGGRGMGNWYSTDWEIRNGKQYSMEIEKSAHMVTSTSPNALAAVHLAAMPAAEAMA